MGTLLFFIALIIEIAFAIYCMVTKQSHQKIRNWVRIAVFVAFTTLTLFSVIIWSFRWILCAILLFIMALIGTVSLIRIKANPYEYKGARIVRKAIIMIVVLTFAFTPVLVFPQYKLPKVTGEYKVATATYTYTDNSRIEAFTDTGKHRFVNVEFWYPQHADGTYPLLVFSHGAYGIKSSNTSTYTELASHGYVVVSIDHPYHSFYTAAADGTKAMINSEYYREVSNANKEGIYTVEELYGLIQKWMKLRTDDMNFVIDTILEKSKSDSNPIYQHINTAKIGVFGHSMGGAASVWLGRERDDVHAVVNIDAPLFSELSYDEDTDDLVATNKTYTTPLLNIYSDDVWRQLDNNSTYAANKAADRNFSEVYTVHFQGAKHLSLTDLPLFSPVLANMLQGGKATIDTYYCIETENQIILNFFDYVLKGIGPFTPKETY
ncbi:Platelet-activating factor acetylhydrolase, isoform II [Paenibacillus sophorae]|uniref:Alpha/beta hydrolase n=1 Tax=Paenibacillus sophorae TaxID=1333845 RepID=A0A1H8TJ42_9BACL|nr:acetylhydrolase [Paenibacillus sophorae]QWU16221.1 alpha/beta hydrolase [Paenibacillus sophorae]SEO90564.1 Platelet-activating factor acetylhydrolase, isoform II [Paenibacillus sophorae]